MRSLLTMAAVMAALASYGAQAGTVTLTGSTFSVTYDTTQLGQYYLPVLQGNTLYFTPNTFSATSTNGLGTVTASSTLSGLVISANPGYELGNVSASALGDYALIGTGSAINITGSLTAADAANSSHQTSSALVLDPTLPINISGFPTNNWAANAALSPAWFANASAVDLSFVSTLSATTLAGTGEQLAFVQEKYAGLALTIDPVPVPLPPAVALLLSGFAGVLSLGVGRRRA